MLHPKAQFVHNLSAYITIVCATTVYKMPGRNETEILNVAIATLGKETGLKVRIGGLQERLEGLDIDARLEIGDDQIPAFAEIKPRIQQANLGAVIDQLRMYGQRTGGEQWILVADYVNPKMAQELRDRGVQFMDTAGNAFIKADNLFVFVKGNKQQQEARIKDATRAFEPTGLRVLYAFLKNPDLVNQPYRVIAEQTGVANGTVGWVINGLKEEGYLRDLGRKRGKKLMNVTKLFYRWVEAYPQKLQKKLELGHWIVQDPYWWKKQQIRAYEGVWGGEIAGAKLTNNLNPLVATVYMPEGRLNELAQTERMKKADRNAIDQEGLVKVYQMFWKPDIDDPDTTDPILTYADLTNTGDPRNMEIAKDVYDKYIDRHLREIA